MPTEVILKNGRQPEHKSYSLFISFGEGRYIIFTENELDDARAYIRREHLSYSNTFLDDQKWNAEKALLTAPKEECPGARKPKLKLFPKAPSKKSTTFKPRRAYAPCKHFGCPEGHRCKEMKDDNGHLICGCVSIA